jgi:L-amino acid N-acyltransferase YncA
MKKSIPASIEIIPMIRAHWPDVKLIYQQGIDSGNATFEITCPDWEKWDSAHRSDCRLVALKEGNVVGWAAISPVSGRCVYSGVAEVSVYVHEKYRGFGVGHILLQALILASEKSGIWTLQAGIFPENSSSINIHRKNGFKEVGVRERLGKMDRTWRDVLLFERRSSSVGID